MMQKSVGAWGLTRRVFEADFIQFCQQENFNVGYECARLLKIAAHSDDIKSFGFLLGIANRTLTESSHIGDNPQGSLLIEWKDEPSAANAA